MEWVVSTTARSALWRLMMSHVNLQQRDTAGQACNWRPAFVRCKLPCASASGQACKPGQACGAIVWVLAADQDLCCSLCWLDLAARELLQLEITLPAV